MSYLSLPFQLSSLHWAYRLICWNPKHWKANPKPQQIVSAVLEVVSLANSLIFPVGGRLGKETSAPSCANSFPRPSKEGQLLDPTRTRSCQRHCIMRMRSRPSQPKCPSELGFVLWPRTLQRESSLMLVIPCYRQANLGTQMHCPLI